ncbi:hypothetical protein D9619_003595 [Psilocybe cf. subviscida]|uniref:F-box domain-containing protein n=1 Tax=Psilocybe cf. subviscida TaxID=2480587 RepID=A0A8H5ETJ5_9AGAR|nr:hypothetical protein D9619_003595 [Psilocybe cf. subviscida]
MKGHPNPRQFQRLHREFRSQYIRNAEESLVPIGKLPNEILGEIFSYVRDAAPSIDINERDNVEPLHIRLQQIQWVTVSHVCRSWREVALRTATLWTEPPLIFPVWATTMLERSQLAAIRSLDINWSAMRRSVISAAVQHLPRVVDLTLRHMEDGNLEELLNEILDVETSKLQSLRIRPRGRVWVNRDHNRRSFTLPETNFTSTKRLRILDLWSVDISWTSHLLSSLTRLWLRDISYARRPTVNELRSMLERMPGLEILSLCDSLPVTTSVEAETGSREGVLLRHLKELQLGGKSFELKTFATNIVPGPNLEEIFIDLLHGGETTDELNGSQRALTRNCPLADIEVVFIHGPDDDNPEWSLKIFPNTEHPNREGLLLTLRPGIFVDNEWVREEGLELKILRFLQLFQTVNWNHLNILDLTSLEAPGADTPSSALLVQTFGALPKLRQTVTGNLMTWVLVEALNITRQTQDADDFIPFPGLETIRLASVSFLEEDSNEPHFHVAELVDCIAKRRERGFPVCNIILEDCTGLVEEEVEMLRDGVIELKFLPESENGPELGSLSDRKIVCCSTTLPSNESNDEDED